MELLSVVCASCKPKGVEIDHEVVGRQAAILALITSSLIPALSVDHVLLANIKADSDGMIRRLCS